MAATIGKLKDAILQLFAHDKDLIRGRSSERNLAHHLTRYMTPLFPNWDVDVEYNRLGSLAAKVPTNSKLIRKSGRQQPVKVYPDIIVHKRESQRNLLVLELKLGKYPNGHPGDMEKLRAMRRQLGYRLGVAVSLFVDENGVPAYCLKQA